MIPSFLKQHLCPPLCFPLALQGTFCPLHPHPHGVHLFHAHLEITRPSSGTQRSMSIAYVAHHSFLPSSACQENPAQPFPCSPHPLLPLFLCTLTVAAHLQGSGSTTRVNRPARSEYLRLGGAIQHETGTCSPPALPARISRSSTKPPFEPMSGPGPISSSGR